MRPDPVESAWWNGSVEVCEVSCRLDDNRGNANINGVKIQLLVYIG